MPQIHHQFLSPNGLPQQPSAGNLYLQSAAAAAAAAGVKFPLSQFKPTTNAANPAHIGMPSGYGSYGSSSIGYNPLSGNSSGKSNSNEDLAASQLKDNHVYTTGPLVRISSSIQLQLFFPLLSRNARLLFYLQVTYQLIC